MLNLPLLAKFPEQICYHYIGIPKHTIHWLPPVFSQLMFPDSNHTQTDLTVLCFTSSNSIVLTLLPFYSQPGAQFLKQHFYSCIFHIYPFPLHSYVPCFSDIFSERISYRKILAAKCNCFCGNIFTLKFFANNVSLYLI